MANVSWRRPWADDIMNEHTHFNFALQWKDIFREDKMIMIVEDSSDHEALTIRSLKGNKIGNGLVVAWY
jgi:hypothetical protein